MDNRRSVFDRFGGGKPRHSDTTAQMLFEYEEHYMRLVKNFRHEIEFINDLHAAHTQEVKNFYGNELPAIQKNWRRNRLPTTCSKIGSSTLNAHEQQLRHERAFYRRPHGQKS